MNSTFEDIIDKNFHTTLLQLHATIDDTTHPIAEIPIHQNHPLTTRQQIAAGLIGLAYQILHYDNQECDCEDSHND